MLTSHFKNMLEKETAHILFHAPALPLTLVSAWNLFVYWPKTGPEFADNLFADISKMLLSQSAPLGTGLGMQSSSMWIKLRLSPYIKRKACICLLRLYRKDLAFRLCV